MKVLYLLSSAVISAWAASYVPFGLDSALTGGIVPKKFLEATYLAGQFPFIASRIDPRVSYSVYVPPEHYNPNPNSTHKKLPLLVEIHGTSRSTESLWNKHDLPAFADGTPCAILAPMFPAGLEGPNDLDSYKVLRTDTLRSDLALLSILDEVAYRWPGVDTSKIYMSGFSGGGQFAHRFMYLHPGRISGISVGAPGTVTLLDEDGEWPDGIADTEKLFNTSVDKGLIGNIPIQLVIGGEDTEIHGSQEFWKWAEETLGSGGVMPRNETRLQAIHKLRDSWALDGIYSELVIVPGVGHDHADPGIRAAVRGFMRRIMRCNVNEEDL